MTTACPPPAAESLAVPDPDAAPPPGISRRSKLRSRSASLLLTHRPSSGLNVPAASSLGQPASTKTKLPREEPIERSSDTALIEEGGSQ